MARLTRGEVGVNILLGHFVVIYALAVLGCFYSKSTSALRPLSSPAAEPALPLTIIVSSLHLIHFAVAVVVVVADMSLLLLLLLLLCKQHALILAIYICIN